MCWIFQPPIATGYHSEGDGLRRGNQQARVDLQLTRCLPDNLAFSLCTHHFALYFIDRIFALHDFLVSLESAAVGGSQRSAATVSSSRSRLTILRQLPDCRRYPYRRPCSVQSRKLLSSFSEASKQISLSVPLFQIVPSDSILLAATGCSQDSLDDSETLPLVNTTRIPTFIHHHGRHFAAGMSLTSTGKRDSS
jgi:hypothetical protein